MTPEPAVTPRPAGSGLGVVGVGVVGVGVVGVGDSDDPPAATRGVGPGGHRVRRIFTTRRGGVSAAPFDSFNLGGAVGDDPAAVTANRARLAAAAGLPPDHVVWMRQVHGTTVTPVTFATATATATVTVSAPIPAAPIPAAPTAGDGPAVLRIELPDAVPERLPDTDGIVTAATGVGLAVLVADCVPMLAADPVAGVIAAVHAGRRGAAAGIAVRMLEQMAAAGASVANVEVLLGPAICGFCYEVPLQLQRDVVAALPGSASTTDRGTPGLDLRAGIARQLRAAGVAGVVIDERCTHTDPELFSHRKAAPTGRLAGLIWMPN